MLRFFRLMREAVSEQQGYQLGAGVGAGLDHRVANVASHRRRTQVQIDTAVCTIDRGVGVILKRKNSDLLRIPHRDFRRLRFQEYAENYVQWIRPNAYDATLQFIEGEN